MMPDQEFVNEEDEEPELEQTLEQLEEKRAEETEEELEEEEPLAEARFVELAQTIEQMLDGKTVDLDTIAALSAEDRSALELLERVVSGRTSGDTIMYAEERLEALNQVLAQLQPLLSVGGMHAVLNESLAALVDGFAELRDRLVGLEDAEEEVFHEAEEKAAASENDDDDAKPTDQPVDEAEKAKQAAAKAAKAAAKAKADKDDELERERKVRKGGEGAATAADDYDTVERPPRKSQVWDPDDTGGSGA